MDHQVPPPPRPPPCSSPDPIPPLYLTAGELEARELVQLSVRDMAGEELKRQRTAWHAKALKRVLKPDWRSGQGGFTCDLFRCDRCGESQTRLHRTIRAGKRVPDEASTLYATCIACNARWEVDR